MIMLLALKRGDGTTYFIGSHNNYIVGRRKAEILLEEDRSISKSHAVIHVGSANATVTDTKSKYKTFLNNKALEPNVPTTLRAGDVLKFGVYNNIFGVEAVKIVTTGSGLNAWQKREFTENITFLNGTVLSNWSSDCTHLTVNKIVLTVKVLEALIDNKPIVSLEYWKEVVERVQKKKVLPDTAEFRPPLAENLLSDVDLAYNPARRELFSRKVFIFPNDQLLAKMQSVVAKCGGFSVCWTRQPVSLSKIESNDKYIVIQSDDAKPPESLLEVHEALRKSGKRTIPFQEIALAILHCSCEMDCNPRFSRVQQVFVKQETNASSSQVYALAAETPTQQPSTQPKQEIVIPASVDSNPEDLFPTPAVRAATSKKIGEPQPSCSKQTTSEVGFFKRIATASYDNPLKRFKMETKPSTPERNLLTLTTNEENSIQQTQSSNVEISRNKRKADATLTPPTPKRSAVKPNPFGMSLTANKPTVSADNPFVALRVKVEPKLADNPFLVRPTNNNHVDNSESINATIEKTEYPSATLPDKSKIVSSSGWSTTSSKVVKINEELKDIFKSFMNTVVLNRIAPVVRRINVSDAVDGTNTTMGARNFKKFRKVAPLKPQTRIIITVATQDNAGNVQEDQQSAGEEEEEEIPRPLPNPVAKKTKRFNF